MFRCPRIFALIAPSQFGARSFSSARSSLRQAVKNEPILEYKSGSKERKELEEAICKTLSKCHEIPIVIGKEEIKTSEVRCQVMPHKHSHVLAQFCYADDKIIKKAIDSAVECQKKWDKIPMEQRICVWECAADLMSGKYRQELNAATMLGQSKTIGEAEIDSAAELIDFTRMNANWFREAAQWQPHSEKPEVTKNRARLRGIDGFFAAISPFNFTAIGGNLAFTPALMGNCVLWKPSDTAILANWVTFKVMREAGVPPGVVNFVPANGPTFGKVITASPHLAGINFTGSVATFSYLWKQVGQKLENKVNFPRLVGEVGGKNYHFVHCSADVETVVSQTIRSAFGFGGQKCSACSRMYVPTSLWPKLKDRLLEERKKLKFGDVTDFSNYLGAVIDENAYKRIVCYLEYIKSNEKIHLLGGGSHSDKTGYFIEPTIVETTDPMDRIMKEEIFGPILTIYVYKDAALNDALELVNTTTQFALTGSIFGRDENFVKQALDVLKMSAGNFYINDKSTGAIVNQQPFGGGRKSGTNDKAGGPHYVLRFASMQAIKETFVPLKELDYPYMN